MIWIRPFHSHVPYNIISMSCSNFHRSLSLFLSFSRARISIQNVSLKVHRQYLAVFVVYTVFFSSPSSFISCLFVHLHLLSLSLPHSNNHAIILSPPHVVHMFVWSFRRFTLYTLKNFALKNLEKIWGTQVTSFLYENFYFLMTLMPMIKMWL